MGAGGSSKKGDAAGCVAGLRARVGGGSVARSWALSGGCAFLGRTFGVRARSEKAAPKVVLPSYYQEAFNSVDDLKRVLDKRAAGVARSPRPRASSASARARGASVGS